MATDVEKVYCLDHGYNGSNGNDALAYLAGQNRGSDPMAMAAMMNGGMNGQWNNPFIYLVWMMFANRFFGNGDAAYGVSQAENFNSRQIATLQDVVNTNHNNDLVLQAINGNRDAMGQLAQTFNCDFNTMQQAICNVKSAIETVGGQVGYSAESVKNAIALGDANIVSKMQECCCANKLMVTEQGYQNQLAIERQTNTISSQMAANHSEDRIHECQNHGALISRIDQLSNGITQGFASMGYENAKNTQAIINAQTASTQRILDQMCANQTQALRDVISEKDRQLQTQTIINQLKKECKCCVD